MWATVQWRCLQRFGLLSPSRRLELFPPFRAMRIRVLELADDWSRVHIRLPLNTRTRNPGGFMFGGYQAALADPIAALACGRRYTGYAVWTRALRLDFEHEGTTDLELRFEFPAEIDAHIRRELAEKRRSTPTFEFGLYRADGVRCTRVHNTVAIRPLDGGRSGAAG